MKIDKKYNLSSNSWSGNNPRSIIFHTTLGGGNISGVINTLKSRGLSYNYVINKGKIYELVNPNRSAWHAGVISRPVLRARIFYKTLKGEDNPNRHSVGIAFDKAQNEPLSEQDIDAAVFLIKHIGKNTKIRYNADNIFCHIDVTDYKPAIVRKYREEVLDGLVGDKDEKDAGEMSYMQLMIKFLTLQLELLRLKKKQYDENRQLGK